MGNDFIPYRRNAIFFNSVDVDIKPLINELSFIKDKKNWGLIFRLGHFEINEKDFFLIKNKMLIDKNILDYSINKTLKID